MHSGFTTDYVVLNQGIYNYECIYMDINFVFSVSKPVLDPWLSWKNTERERHREGERVRKSEREREKEI